MLSFAVWRAQIFKALIVLLQSGTLPGVKVHNPQMLFIVNPLLDSFFAQNIFQHFDLIVKSIDLFALRRVHE